MNAAKLIPITIVTAPIIVGGNILSIHFTPVNLTINANIPYTARIISPPQNTIK